MFILQRLINEDIIQEGWGKAREANMLWRDLYHKYRGKFFKEREIRAARFLSSLQNLTELVP